MSETPAQIIERTAPEELIDHNLVPQTVCEGILFEKKPARDLNGNVAEGLYNIWITLDNPKQYNSYTTEMVKGAILAFRAASNSRDVNAVVFTATGDKAFCMRSIRVQFGVEFSNNDRYTFLRCSENLQHRER